MWIQGNACTLQNNFGIAFQITNSGNLTPPLPAFQNVTFTQNLLACPLGGTYNYAGVVLSDGNVDFTVTGVTITNNEFFGFGTGRSMVIDGNLVPPSIWQALSPECIVLVRHHKTLSSLVASIRH
jgi:hypothetical protein